jgi:Zn-dependent M32 family carboxypeptidase
VRNANWWVGYIVMPCGESTKIIKAAIDAADFDLEKFRIDHTTHPLLLKSRRGWTD